MRATASIARNGGAYLTTANRGREADRLIAITAAAAKKAELHANLMENNIMKMWLTEALGFYPGEPLVLEPGGLDIMLIGLKAPKNRVMALGFAAFVVAVFTFAILVGVINQLTNRWSHGLEHEAGQRPDIFLRCCNWRLLPKNTRTSHDVTATEQTPLCRI